MKVVLDTNVWLDWLVFRDPSVEPLRRAHADGCLAIVTDEACAAELERVLAYDMGRWSLNVRQRERCLASFRAASIVLCGAAGSCVDLPSCSDADDQKFLKLAASSGAHALVTKDQALLDLARRRLPFRIVKPAELLHGPHAPSPA